MIILNNTNVYIQETEVFAAYKHLFGFKKEKSNIRQFNRNSQKNTSFLTKHERPVHGPIIKDSKEPGEAKSSSSHQLRRPSPSSTSSRCSIFITGR